ncbi:MAG TPA: hypothetical protein VFP93_02635, partial [Gammaproteobacteria bacterium]|nr:hypothetical protein [Gammaproteobacteria bacterium]
MKFVVQLNKTGKAPAKRIEKDLELQDTYAVLANLWNAGLTHISAENLIKSEQMEAIIQDLIERNVGEEIINFKGKIKNAPFHLRLEGTWDEDGSYELTKIIFYENHYTSKFDLNSVKQKKKAGTAQEVLNTFESTLENDHVLNQEPAPINNASNANEERRFVLNNENQD